MHSLVATEPDQNKPIFGQLEISNNNLHTLSKEKSNEKETENINYINEH